jgi:hypothetical protein
MSMPVIILNSSPVMCCIDPMPVDNYPFPRDLLLDPSRVGRPRLTVVSILRSTISAVSAPATTHYGAQSHTPPKRCVRFGSDFSPSERCDKARVLASRPVSPARTGDGRRGVRRRCYVRHTCLAARSLTIARNLSGIGCR